MFKSTILNRQLNSECSPLHCTAHEWYRHGSEIYLNWEIKLGNKRHLKKELGCNLPWTWHLKSTCWFWKYTRSLQVHRWVFRRFHCEPCCSYNVCTSNYGQIMVWHYWHLPKCGPDDWMIWCFARCSRRMKAILLKPHSTPSGNIYSAFYRSSATLFSIEVFDQGNIGYVKRSHPTWILKSADSLPGK